jgi:hypothetical protein
MFKVGVKVKFNQCDEGETCLDCKEDLIDCDAVNNIDEKGYVHGIIIALCDDVETCRIIEFSQFGLHHVNIEYLSLDIDKKFEEHKKRMLNEN